MKNNLKDSGYIALITVVILGAVVAVIAVSLVLLGLGHTRTSLSEIQSANALSAANSCAEEALKKIRMQHLYTGTGGLTLADSTCTYTVLATTTSSIVAVGISGSVTRTIDIDLSARTPNIIFTNWQDI